jgi:hypothetical protein
MPTTGPPNTGPGAIIPLYNKISSENCRYLPRTPFLGLAPHYVEPRSAAKRSGNRFDLPKLRRMNRLDHWVLTQLNDKSACHLRCPHYCGLKGSNLLDNPTASAR